MLDSSFVDSPVTTVPLVNEVASVIRERIYAGRYPPGEWLRQEGISAELGISRTPVREALRVLESEGLIRISAGRGARVVSGDVRALLDAYELRAVVDGLAARLAASAATPSRIAELHRSIERQLSALQPWNPERYTQCNVDFHCDILMITGNEYLIDQKPLIRMTAQVFRPVALVQADVAETAIRQHQGILEAIAAGDQSAAEDRARSHIQTTIDRLRASGSNLRAQSTEGNS